MDTSKKPKDKKATAQLLTKQPKVTAITLVLKAEGANFVEEKDISLALLKRQDIEERISQMPTSEEVVALYEDIKHLKNRKTDEHFSKVEGYMQILAKVEGFKGTDVEEVKKCLRMAITAGVSDHKVDQTQELR